MNSCHLWVLICGCTDVHGVHLPISQGNARGTVAWPGVSYRTHEVRVKFSAGELSLTLSVWLPDGAGPFPVVLDIDGCWKCFSDDIIRTVVDRGYIAASVDRTEAADDNKDHYRDSGLYRIFPAAEFGVCSAWAWAAHRCVDALIGMKEVQSNGIAVTGHSRGGKAAILAGVTDERIAVTNPNNSGCGGAGLLRLKGSRAEEINSFWSRDTGEPQNAFWFGKGWHNSRKQDDQLPYDSHFLHAMVAPRALLLTEAYEDSGANPASSYLAAQHARQVYSTLGVGESIGWAFREGGHAHGPEDYGALLDFMDVCIKKKPIIRDFQRQLYPDLADILKRFDDPTRVQY